MCYSSGQHTVSKQADAKAFKRSGKAAPTWTEARQRFVSAPKFMAWTRLLTGVTSVPGGMCCNSWQAADGVFVAPDEAGSFRETVSSKHCRTLL